MGLLIIAAAFGILLFFTLVLKKSLLLSSAIALVVSLLLINLFFGFKLKNLLQASMHGLLTATEISLLVFGALVFFNYLKADKFIQKFEGALHQFSSNKLIIVIFLALFFGSFIEGVSGFGTPAMIIAPLLLGLRFPAYLAAALPLLANTIPVIFGASGTPIKVGYADLPVEQVPIYAAMLMLMPAMLLPLAFKRFLEADDLLAQDSNKIKSYWIAMSAGLSFVIPFIFFSYIGPDFPSILAAVTGLLCWLFLIKTTGKSYATINRTSLTQFFHTFKPYLFIAALLIVGKLFLGSAKLNVKWIAIGLQKNIPLFQPGLFFILGLLILYSFTKNRSSISLKNVFKQTALKIPSTFITIACLAVLAKLLSQNLQVKEIIGSTTNMPVILFYVLAVATGFIGSFMAGSATVSNLLFGTEWYQVGQQYQLQIPLLLACQLAGAALGNGLSIQNIAIVQAVLNEKGLESSIIKKLWKMMLLLFLLICASAIFISLFHA